MKIGMSYNKTYREKFNDLVAAGWKPVRRQTWRAPGKALHAVYVVGTHTAWVTMRKQAKRDGTR